VTAILPLSERLKTRLEHEVDTRSVGLGAWLLRRTKGRVARAWGRRVLVLTTTGRRSGRTRVVPLQYFPDGDRMVVVAANSGLPAPPGWYFNLTSTPVARVEVDGRSLRVRAEELSDAEAAAFWPRVLQAAPDYARYPRRTSRRIPMVRLVPVLDEPPPQELASGPRDRGEVDVGPFPTVLRIGRQARRAGRHMAPMHALVDIDVTDARRRLDESHPPLSLTAFVLACVARAVAAHPQVHAYRDWQGRLVRHLAVDVGTIIEAPSRHGSFGMPYLVRDAHLRSVADITARAAPGQGGPDRDTGGASDRPGAHRAPGGAGHHTAAVARGQPLHPRPAAGDRHGGRLRGRHVRRGGGFAFGEPTVHSLAVFVGGCSVRPRVVDGRVQVREVLDLTLTFDHDVVDGAPAARFVAALRGLMEAPDAGDLWVPEERRAVDIHPA